MTGKTIGVVVPAYNAARFIRPAIASLLREAELGLDIIVVDDGSTDNTGSIVAEIAAAHPAVRLIEGPHAGVSRARNLGLDALSPETRHVTFLDADDHSYPGRIRRQAAALNADHALVAVVGMVRLFEAIDEKTSEPLPGSRTITVGGALLAAGLFDRRVFDTIGRFDETMHYGEDIDFYLRMLEARLPYRAETELAVLYRRHDANATNNIALTRRGFMDAIRKSLARRRASGDNLAIGDLFATRRSAEEAFLNG